MRSDSTEKGKILIVDDTPINLELLLDLLADYGCKILVAEDGASAVEMAEYGLPDMILLDVLMPGMDGFETCRCLKSNPATQDIPVIFMTALSDTVEKVKGLNLGAVDYITKPLQHEEVLARIDIHLRLRNLTKRLTEQNERLEEEIAERKRVEEKLRCQWAELVEWKNRYEAVIQASGQILYDWDPRTNDIIFGGNFEQILGYSHAEMSGGLNRWLEWVHPEDRNLFKEEIEQVLATREPFYLRYRVGRKDGSYITVEDKGYFFVDSAGDMARMVGFVVDISDRQRSEAERDRAFQALQESEARFRRLVESNIIGMILADLKGNITDANDAFLKMLGYERSQLLSGDLRWDNITPPEYSALDEGAIAQFLNSGACTPYEKEYIRSDGSRIPAIVGGALLEQSQQTMVGFAIDIRDRKQAEQKIREQAALIDITTDAIFVRDLLSNQILYWNKGAERLYGWKATEAIGQNPDKLLYSHETLSQLQNNQQALTESDSWQGELEQIAKEGKEIVVASRCTLVRDKEGKPKSILTVNTDITEKKQLEAQFLRAQRLESLGTLASGIAHDLNNALTPMLLSVRLLERKLQDVEGQQWLSILETNIKRGADLVKQVLSFARGVEGGRALLQVEHLISEIERIARQAFPKAIDIQIDIQEQNLWTIYGNTTQLHQVLLNLCVNARDAMPEGGLLKISAKNIWIDAPSARLNIDAKIGPYIMISVSDTGTGIPKEIVDRIFEPFFTTKELGKGTGLGLSTAIGIVKSHGGFINVNSELGKGTEFQVCLPVTQTETTVYVTEKRPELLPGKGELILIVDDEECIREIAKTLLEQNAYKVIVANDGIEAVALYAEYKEEIRVALVDMMMPILDGPTLIRLLQKINPEVDVIGVSGLVLNHQTIERLGNSLKTFLPKPFTAEELLQKVHEVLAGKYCNLPI